MFVDEARITVAGGDGGDGCLSFRREKYVPRGGPDGGDGGNGGSVILSAERDTTTLLAFRYRSIYRADRGRHGQGAMKSGRSGKDLVVAVPVGTVVMDESSSTVLADLSHPGERYVGAQGGHGGRGNARFATSTNRAPRRHEPGILGEERVLRLELKLLADVALVGLPNAGKSTLISRISAARPKIADYPFTTLVPNLGVVDRGDFRSFVVADIPGLIEGAHRGAGLGHRFLRHVERCRLILHLVDLAAPSGDPVADVEVVDQELGRYREELGDKPQILVGTKFDAVQDPAPLRRLEAYAARRRLRLLVVSAVAGTGIDRLVAETGSALDRLDRGEPVGAPPSERAPRGRRVKKEAR